MSLSLEPAKVDHVSIISEMAHRIWKQHYVPIIGSEQVDYMLGQMYSEDAIVKQMETGQNFYLIVYNSSYVGYMAISEKGPKEYMLHKFYIETEQQGKHIGEQAYTALLKEISGAQQVKLTVNRQNYNSMNFYFKIGFKIETVADFDIGNGYYMNDFVMSCKI